MNKFTNDHPVIIIECDYSSGQINNSNFHNHFEDVADKKM